MRHLMRIATGLGLVVALVAAGAPTSPAVDAGADWPTCGRWIAVSTPLVGSWTVLEDVAVISPTDAWAVGYAQLVHRQVAVAVHWDGRRWSRVPTPTIRGWHMLSGIAARSTDDVWAVGTRYEHVAGEPRGRTLIARWDGERWRVVHSPAAWWSARLTSIEVVPGTRVAWAVGVADPRSGGSAEGLTLRWNGAEWRRVAVPGAAGALADVTVRGRVVWAVGADDAEGHAFTMRRARHAWKQVPTRRGADPFVAIAAQPRGDLWASGIDALYRLDAGHWRAVRRLPTGTSAWGLTFPSPTDGWAVGGKPTGGEWEAPFAMRKQGERWARSPVPSPEGSSTLIAIDGTAHDLWAIAYPIGYSGSAIAFHHC